MSNEHKVLLIDDNPINIKIGVIHLKELGFTNVETAINGLKALALIDESYSLVLLDICLPDINGFDLCKMLREKVNYKKIPIIAVTTFTENIHDKCCVAGIDDVVSKPVAIKILQDKINKWLNN